jgi:hypothetical protein
MSQNWLASYWQCPLCDERFDRRDMLSSHLRSKKHSGSGEKVNEERDFYRNGCDDDFTKRCGFCGEVCKGFKVFTRHIGKHFRGTASEPPKSMRDWRDTRDDDDDDSNSDGGKGAGRTGKPKNNGDRHERGAGSNGGTSDSSEGGNNNSSKSLGHSRDRGSKQGDSRSGQSSTVFKVFDSSSAEGSLSLSDTALPFSIRRIRERRRAGGLPLRPENVGKQPQRPSVSESINDAVEIPILTAQKSFHQVSDSPQREAHGSEVIVDAAERWKAFRLKYDSFRPKTQDTKPREHSSSSSSRGGPRRLYAHEDRLGSLDAKVKQYTQNIKTVDDSMIARASADEALQARSASNATRKTKQRKRSRHRIQPGNANTQGGSRHHLGEADPPAAYKLSGKNGKISYADGLDLMLSAARVSFAVENSGNIMRAGAGGTRAQWEDRFYTIDNFMPRYKKLDIGAQKYVSEHLYDINQWHQESSWRSGPGIPQKRHAPIVSDRSRQQATLTKPSRGTLEGSFFEYKQSRSGPVLPSDSHTIRKRGSTAQPDQLQPVPHPRSEDHGKHYRRDLKCPPLDAPSIPDLMALSPQPAGFTSVLPTLAHHFASIGVGEYAACERFMKRHPDILENGQQASRPKRSYDRHTTRRHRQQQDFLDIDYYNLNASSPWELTGVEEFPPKSSSLDRSEQKARDHRHENENWRIVVRWVSCSDVPDLHRISYSGSPFKWAQWFAPTNNHGGNGIADPGFNPTDIQSAVSACSAAALTYKDWGAPSLLTMTKWQNREKHPSDITATQMPDMHRALHFAPVDFGFAASILFEDCRSSSSPEATSVSKLKQHLFRAHSRPEYTCRCCFKIFRTRSKWLGHAERRLCSIDNMRSRALMAKDRRPGRAARCAMCKVLGNCSLSTGTLTQSLEYQTCCTPTFSVPRLYR